MRPITELEELKRLEASIMFKVHSFCEENSIKYFLAYGTLLGAVRHGGFIPWDDDIDIHMMREDYELFCAVFPSWAEKHGLSLVNAHTSSYYGRDMSKVIDTRTLIYEPEFLGDDPIGVFIDIWPLDKLPNHPVVKRGFINANRIKQKLYYLRISRPDDGNLPQKVVRRLIRSIDSRKAILDIERFHKRYAEEKTDSLMCMSDPYLKELPADAFNKTVKLDFEGQKLNAPIGYDNILKVYYGDYMKLPPAEKRKPHHIIDTYWK